MMRSMEPGDLYVVTSESIIGREVDLDTWAGKHAVVRNLASVKVKPGDVIMILSIPDKCGDTKILLDQTICWAYRTWFMLHTEELS